MSLPSSSADAGAPRLAGWYKALHHERIELEVCPDDDFNILQLQLCAQGGAQAALAAPEAFAGLEVASITHSDKMSWDVDHRNKGWPSTH